MTARNNLNNQVAGETQRSTDRVVALFSKREDAYRALSKLKEAGFDNDRIGLAVGHEQEQTQEYDSSFWQKIKDFFTGEEHHEETDFRMSQHRWAGRMNATDTTNEVSPAVVQLSLSQVKG